MLKKTLTYEDLDGNSLTEDFYFNLSKAEIAEMELSHDGGFSEQLRKIVEANDGASIVKTFTEILSKAYGVRGEDNKQFEKSPELSRKFMQTDAYSVLFMELVTDADASAAFIRGVIPASLGEKLDLPAVPALPKPPPMQTMDIELPIETQLSGVAKVMSEPQLSGVAKVMSEPIVEETSYPTGKDLMNMSREDLIEAMKVKNADRLQQ